MGCLVRSAECSASPIVVGPWYYRFLPFGVHLESDFCPSHTANHGRQDEIVVPALSAASTQLPSPKGVMNEWMRAAWKHCSLSPGPQPPDPFLWHPVCSIFTVLPMWTKIDGQRDFLRGFPSEWPECPLGHFWLCYMKLTSIIRGPALLCTTQLGFVSMLWSYLVSVLH